MRRLRSDGLVRKLLPGERDALLGHLLRLDMDSRRTRFGHVDGAFLAAYARQAFADGAVLHGWFEHGTLRAVAELHPLGSWRKAEAAFSVEAPYQDLGIGSRLLDATLVAARNRGATALEMQCLFENRRMQAIARKGGARLRFDYAAACAEIVPRRPTALSYLREAITDSSLFAEALFDLPARRVGIAGA